MSTYNQGECVVKVDNISDVLTDYSDEIVSVTVNGTRPNSQQGRLGLAHMKATLGKRQISGTIVVERETSTTSLYHVLKTRFYDTNNDEAFTLEISMPDGGVGSIKETGEIKITGWDNGADANSGEFATVSVPFIADGAWTYGVIS